MNCYEHSGVEEETDSSVLMAPSGSALMASSSSASVPNNRAEEDANFLSPTVHIRTVKKKNNK